VASSIVAVFWNAYLCTRVAWLVLKYRFCQDELVVFMCLVILAAASPSRPWQEINKVQP
jgi:hypothetical protein